MADMIDRVAKAVHAQNWNFKNDRGFSARTFDSIGETNQNTYRRIARAAIAAMRNPTPEMIEATHYPNTNQDSSLEECWEVMIDAALAEHQPK